MELNVSEAKEKTIEFLNKTSYSLVRPEFSKYSVVYVFTTENLSFLEKMDVNNKDVLTVTGSFDHALNLAFEGAKSICNFDINHLAFFFAQLKLAALKVLSYEEYLNFFGGTLKFNYQIYLKLRNFLESNSLEYWDFLYEHFNYDGNEMSKSRLFDNGGSLTKFINSNPYLKSAENYNITKIKVKNIDFNFNDNNVLDIGKFPEKYDLMLFSNIESYLVDDVFSTMSFADYINFIENQASKQLNDNGIIQMAYNYDYRYNIKEKSKNILKRILEKNKDKSIYNKKEYLEEFKKIVFIGYNLSNNVEISNDVEDCIYLYVKNETRNR